MKVVHIGKEDRYSRSFNGALLVDKMKKQFGVDSSLLVMLKCTENPAVNPIFPIKGRGRLLYTIETIEERLALQSMLYPFSYTLPFHKHFYQADIIHYHLIHDGFFSLYTLPLLSRIKPTVWTLHDPWALTGHCIYPMDCKKWETGCSECPYLDLPKPLKKDNTALLWKVKKNIFQKSKLDIIVASNYMLNLVRRSPLTSHFPIHLVPFGLDLSIYKKENIIKAKKMLNIPPGNFVIGFRSTSSPFKGLEFITEALKLLDIKDNVTLLNFNQRGLLKDFYGHIPVFEMGWLDDANDIAHVYQACDVFLMPSLAEAFGLMAIEAMACGKPVIVFDNTSLPEIVHADEGAGIVVPYKDSKALAQEIKRLMQDDNYRQRVGDMAYKISRDYYDEALYHQRLWEVYNTILYRDEYERYLKQGTS